jgi:SecD/SecF fusion protein
MWMTQHLLFAGSSLFAQSSQLTVAAYLLGVVALFVVPSLLGRFLARKTRAPEYRTRLSIILFTILAGLAVVGLGRHPKFGVDLAGGVILVYQVDLVSSRTAAAIDDGASADDAGAETEGEAGTEGEAAEKEPPADDQLSGAEMLRSDIDMGSLVEAMKRRLNPDGLKEIVIRPFGANQLEIIVPEADEAEIREIKRSIATAGVLMFRIVATPTDAQTKLALEQLQNPLQKMSTEVWDSSKKLVARWVPVDREEKSAARNLRVDVSGDIIRDGRTGNRIALPPDVRNTENSPNAVETWLADQGIEAVEVLMIEPPSEQDVRGDHVAFVRSDIDQRTMGPAVSFTMTRGGGARMGALTSSNLPSDDMQPRRRLGIVLDNELLSAPEIRTTITDNGQITGRFTQPEVDFLISILRAGRLPAVLHKEPISENQIGPMLGRQTIVQGATSIAISLAAVLVFVAVYYRLAGIVACLALLLNLLCTVALMILLSASLTLPGLAGLVLTVGMSVDANVLIFERIREEIKKGATLRMAIRNGFARATTTIVDANLTTLITGIVLYAIGTDQVRGFAVTLIFGILMCMYTSIYCARAVFDIFERNRWITRLNMMDLVGDTRINFMSKTRICVAISLLLIVAGIAGVAMRGGRLLDIDFSGGISVVMYLQEGEDDARVRQKLDQAFSGRVVNGVKAQYTLHEMPISDYPARTTWKIDSQGDVEELKKLLQTTFSLKTYSMTFETPEVVEAPSTTENTTPPSTTPPSTTPPGTPGTTPPSTTPPSTTPPSTTPPSTPGTTPPTTPETKEPASGAPGNPDPENGEATKKDDAAPASPAENPPAQDGEAQDGEAQDGAPSGNGCQETPAKELTKEAPPGDAPQDPPATDADKEAAPPEAAKEGATAPPSGEPVPPGTPASDPPAPSTTTQDPAATATTAPEPVSGPGTIAGTRTTVRFLHKVARSALEKLIEQAARDLNLGTVFYEVVPSELDETGRQASRAFSVNLGATVADSENILRRVQSTINGMPIWIQASEIGSQVAGDTQEKAIWALITSLLGIVVYIWLRFQRLEFGLAAVLALVHDVLITLGAIALSHYVAGKIPFLQIEEFKISLPVVAAFLTLVGYSLNDTIVVFDRIREVRGKSPELTIEMINTSVNQTLSRTFLTSGTTLLVILILYFMGGAGIHGFAFTLLVGILVGTYSSVFIAAPALHWMLLRQQQVRGHA